MSLDNQAKNITRIETVSGKRLALGMDWESLVGNGRESDEIKEYSNKIGSEYYARSKIEANGTSENLVGFVTGLDKADLRGKLYSAAQAFASMEGVSSNAIIVWDFPDGKTWVCQAINGFPVVGMDFVAEKVFAHAEAENQATYNNSDTPIDFYGNSKSFPSKYAIGLDDIGFDCGKDDEIKRVASINISPTTLITSLVLIALLAGGGWYYMEQKRIAEAKRKAAEAQQVDPNVLYAQSLASTNPGVSASKRWAEIKHIFDNMPTYVFGWGFTKAECKLSPEHLCTITLNRVDGTSLDLDKSAGLPEDAIWSADGSFVQYTIPLSEETIENAYQIKDAPPIKTVMIGFMSKVQDASTVGLKIGLGTPAPWAVPAGVSFGDIKNDTLVSSGTWDADGDYWMTDIAKEMPDNFTITDVTITYANENVVFNMKGNYYAKN